MVHHCWDHVSPHLPQRTRKACCPIDQSRVIHVSLVISLLHDLHMLPKHDSFSSIHASPDHLSSTATSFNNWTIDYHLLRYKLLKCSFNNWTIDYLLSLIFLIALGVLCSITFIPNVPSLFTPKHVKER